MFGFFKYKWDGFEIEFLKFNRISYVKIKIIRGFEFRIIIIIILFPFQNPNSFHPVVEPGFFLRGSHTKYNKTVKCKKNINKKIIS